MERLHPKMVDYIKRFNPIISIHNHVLNHNHTPDGFLGVRLPWLFTHWRLEVLERVVGFLGRLKIKIRGESMKYLRNFIDVFDNETSLRTFEELLSKETEPTIYGLLMMDMSISIAGNMTRTIVQQMDDMAVVRDKYPHKVLPFIAIDPNNPDAMKNFELAFSDKYNFFGVKIYPSLGYLPSHPTLMKIFAICEKNNIPVVAHCSSCCMKPQYTHLHVIGSDVVDGKIVEVDKIVLMKTKDDYQKFNAPMNWLPVLMTYPNLRLNLAHFAGVDWPRFTSGRNDTWVNDIIDLMWKYENLYTDFSYTLCNKNYYFALKQMVELNFVVKNRLMYGTDWFMCLQEGDFNNICGGFRVYMGSKIMNQIARENPKRFLNI